MPARAAARRTAPADRHKLSCYDRLYFDLNRDLDLTNDPVLKPMKAPPWDAIPQFSWSHSEKMVFQYLEVQFDYGPGVGLKPFRILPWFESNENNKQRTMYFVAATACEGTIRIGTHHYAALLAQAHLITGRFDRPSTALYRRPLDTREQHGYRGFDADVLGTMQRVDSQLYVISASPLGDKLMVKPYRGDYGAFQIGPGGRDIKEIGLSGSLCSPTAALSVGSDRTAEGLREKISRCQVPVGDYLPAYLTIEYGPLRIGLADNHHSDGKPRDAERRRAYNIKIRKDKPFVLDFSNRPEVLFASPAKDQTFRPGDEIRVAAVLVDPVLDVMIRSLSDARRTQKATFSLGNGAEINYGKDLSLDPLVAITDSAGKTVSQGEMPFG